MHTIGRPFITLQSVDSTNNYAMAQVHAGLARHGAAWFAYSQYAGKGQRGKNWNAEPGENIILSVVIEPFLSIQQQFALSASVAVACQRFFSKYAGDETKIKWPNDLYWRDRKAGGILIENIIKGTSWSFAIAGIGININQTRFPETLLNPVSLKQVTGKDFDPVEMARELCIQIDEQLVLLKEKGISNMIEIYNQFLYKRDEKLRLKKSNAVFETRVIEVNEHGQLITEDVVKRAFEFGEVEWMF